MFTTSESDELKTLYQVESLKTHPGFKTLCERMQAKVLEHVDGKAQGIKLGNPVTEKEAGFVQGYYAAVKAVLDMPRLAGIEYNKRKDQ